VGLEQGLEPGLGEPKGLGSRVGGFGNGGDNDKRAISGSDGRATISNGALLAALGASCTANKRAGFAGTVLDAARNLACWRSRLIVIGQRLAFNRPKGSKTKQLMPLRCFWMREGIG
jgi:hypothetical protein